MTSIDSEFDDESGAPSEDGRRLRRARNRAAVIDSLLELIRMGETDPTVSKIAERAGVSHRSVFRYFDDMDDLARTAIDQELREADLLVRQGVDERHADHHEQVGEVFNSYRLGAVSQHRVIDKTGTAKRLCQQLGLFNCWVKTVFVGTLDHASHFNTDSVTLTLGGAIPPLPKASGLLAQF